MSSGRTAPVDKSAPGRPFNNASRETSATFSYGAILSFLCAVSFALFPHLKGSGQILQTRTATVRSSLIPTRNRWWGKEGLRCCSNANRRCLLEPVRPPSDRTVHRCVSHGSAYHHIVERMLAVNNEFIDNYTVHGSFPASAKDATPAGGSAGCAKPLRSAPRPNHVTIGSCSVDPMDQVDLMLPSNPPSVRSSL